MTLATVWFDPPDFLYASADSRALVRDLDAAKEVLGSLRESGGRIALDDFGTGYSSLYHLRNFKFDAIKIDRSFVESMNFENESAAIVNALTGLGHGLSLTITAEDIELSEQRNALLKHGCQQGQGFLFSRAVPAMKRGNCYPALVELLDAGLPRRCTAVPTAEARPEATRASTDSSFMRSQAPPYWCATVSFVLLWAGSLTGLDTAGSCRSADQALRSLRSSSMIRT